MKIFNLFVLFVLIDIAVSYNIFAAPIASGEGQAIEYISNEQLKLLQPYIKELKQKALDKELFNRRRWLKLLHYEKTRVFRRLESQGIAEYFFNSPKGRKSPRAELLATIEAFFTGDKLHAKQMHPQCRFPARYFWLDQELHFDKNKMPLRECARFKKWNNRLKPGAITIVFSSFFMNSPASMFGHTFLKLDRDPHDNKEDLLDYGINYSAHTGKVNAFTYFIKGIFGGFPGLFTMHPYYLKVNEYNYAESRDIWEFELNFKQNEIDFLMMHIWEMGATHFDYYFFDKNCSYQILTLLEAAKPSLHISDQFFFPVQPLDTVKILEKNKAIRKVRYRASAFSKYLRRYQKLNSANKDLVKSIIEGNEINTDVNGEALDTAIDFLAYKTFYKPKAKKAELKIYQNLLTIRSKMPTEASKTLTEPPRGIYNPLLAHDSSQWLLGGGYSTKGPFALLTWRTALRDMMDNSIGYPIYSQVFIGAAAFRYYSQTDKYPQLEYLRLVDVISIYPYDSVSKKYSWKLRFGFENFRKETPNLESPNKIFYYMEAGIGPAFQKQGPGFISKFLFYTLANIRIDIASGFSPFYRIAPVLESGLFWQLTQRNKLHFYGSYRFYVLGQTSIVPVMGIAYNFSWFRSLSLESRYESYLNSKYNEMSLKAKYYF